MKKLLNLFKRKKKTYTSVNDLFKVLIIDEESNQITTTLGITEERTEELFQLVKTVYKKYEDITKCYVDICAECKHINEVVFSIGVMHERNARKGPNIQVMGAGNMTDFLNDLHRRITGEKPDEDE